MREVVIVSAVRTPVGKAYKGTLRATRPDDLAAFAIKGALERVPQLDAKEIEDVIVASPLCAPGCPLKPPRSPLIASAPLDCRRLLRAPSASSPAGPKSSSLAASSR